VLQLNNNGASVQGCDNLIFLAAFLRDHKICSPPKKLDCTPFSESVRAHSISELHVSWQVFTSDLLIHGQHELAVLVSRIV